MGDCPAPYSVMVDARDVGQDYTIMLAQPNPLVQSNMLFSLRRGRLYHPVEYRRIGVSRLVQLSPGSPEISENLTRSPLCSTL
jgi:hypothetical protein